MEKQKPMNSKNNFEKEQSQEDSPKQMPLLILKPQR